MTYRSAQEKALFSRSLREQKFSNANCRGENPAKFRVSSCSPLFSPRDFAEKLRENSRRNTANFRGVSPRNFAQILHETTESFKRKRDYIGDITILTRKGKTHIRLGIRSGSPSDQRPRCPHEETVGPYLPIVIFRGVSPGTFTEFLRKISRRKPSAKYVFLFFSAKTLSRARGVPRRNAKKEFFSWADLYVAILYLVIYLFPVKIIYFILILAIKVYLFTMKYFLVI